MNVLSAVTPPCVPLNFETQVLKEYNEVAHHELFLTYTEVVKSEGEFKTEDELETDAENDASSLATATRARSQTIESQTRRVADASRRERRRENRREYYSKLSQALRRARISYDAANRGVEDVSPDVQTNVDPEELDQHVPATTRMIKIDIDQIKPQLSEVIRSFEYCLLNAQTT